MIAGGCFLGTTAGTASPLAGHNRRRAGQKRDSSGSHNNLPRF
jgi:hypothetical protein